MSLSLNVSVTTIAQYVCRAGDLSGGSSTSVSGIQGTQLHRKIFKELEKTQFLEFAKKHPQRHFMDGQRPIQPYGKKPFPPKPEEIEK